MADIQLRPGEKFRLGRTSYEVLSNADIDAQLVESNGDKQDIRQVLYTCPKGCVCEGTKKVWKCRYSRKQHATNPGKCPMCGETLVEGQPEQKAQSVPPNACELAPPDQPQQPGGPQDGNTGPQSPGDEPQTPSKDGTQKDLDDLKDTLQKAKDEAKGKQPKQPKGDNPSKGKNKGKGDQSKGKDGHLKKSPAEQKLDNGEMAADIAKALAELQAEADAGIEALEQEQAENVAGNEPDGHAEQPPPQKEGLHRCFNCEHPTNRPAGKGDIHLCDMCEDMREHILECLN